MKTLVIHPEDKSTDFLNPIYYGRDWTVITEGTKDEVRWAIDEHDHIIMMGHGTPQGLLSVGKFTKEALPVEKPSTAIRKDGPATKETIKEFYSSVDREPGSDDDLDDWASTPQDQLAGPPYHYNDPFYGYRPKNKKPFFRNYTTGYVIDDTNADQLRKKKVTAIWCNADQYMEWNNLSGFYTGMFISDTSEAQLIGTEDTDEWIVEESNYEFARLMRECILLPNSDTLTEVKRGYGRLAERNKVAQYNMLRLFSRYADQTNFASDQALKAAP